MQEHRPVDAAPGIGLVAGAALASFGSLVVGADQAIAVGAGAGVGLVAGATVRALIGARNPQIGSAAPSKEEHT